MLQVFRDSMKYLAWILWVIIAVFVLFVFVDFGRSSNYARATGGNAAATIGTQAISYREYDHELRQIQEQLRQRFGNSYTTELEEQLRVPQQALNRLISRKILLAEAEKLDLGVSDKELRRYIVALPVMQDTQGAFVGTDAYQRVVQRLGYTPESFEQQMRDDLMLQRLLGALGRSVVVTDADVESRYREQNEKSKLRYVALPFATTTTPPAVSDADLAKFFAEHREQFRLPEQRMADYLLVDQTALEQTISVTDQEQRDYFQEHHEEYAQPEQIRARHILVDTPELAAAAKKRLDSGEDFAKVAKEMSKDTGSGANGGDLGWFGKGRMVPEFEQAAFSAAIGAVVGPVKTQFGYHLIQVQEKRAASTTPFEQVAQAVRTRIAAERAATAAEEKAKTISAEVTKAGANARQKMQELASQPGLEVGQTQPFGRQGAVAPLGSAPELNAVGFQLEKGGVSQPIRTPRGWVVLHVAEVKPPHVPELAEVRESVRREAQQDALKQQAFRRLAEAKAKPGATLDSIAAELGAKVQETPELSGQSSVIPGLGFAPELTKEMAKQQVGVTAGPVAAVGNALLYEVSSRTGLDPAVFAQQKDGLRQQMEQEQVSALVSSLVNARKQELGVTYDPQLLKTMGLDAQTQSKPPQRG
jgi:peptidyl-prolyl cis-trans isomerase D